MTNESADVPPTALEEFAGTEVEIDGEGDYIVDTTGAESGKIRLNVKDSARLVIEFEGAPAFEVYKDGGNVRIDLGEGADQRLVLGDALKDLLNQFFQSKYDVHTHPTSMGPSGPPLPLFTGAQITDDVLSDLAKTKKS